MTNLIEHLEAHLGPIARGYRDDETWALLAVVFVVALLLVSPLANGWVQRTRTLDEA